MQCKTDEEISKEIHKERSTISKIIKDVKNRIFAEIHNTPPESLQTENLWDNRRIRILGNVMPLAEKYGETNAYYGWKLQLLDLPEKIQELLTQVNSLTETHCRHICKLVNKKDLINRFETLCNQPQDKWIPEQRERFEQERNPWPLKLK